MALPLPRVVADVGPGGPLLNAMNAINSYANNAHLKNINKVKEQWAPTTVPAEAYSKLAYANAVGPQMLAKILQNEITAGNLTDEQAKAALQRTFGAGMGQGNGANAFNFVPPKNESFMDHVTNAFKNLTAPFRTSPQQPAVNAFNQPIVPQNNQGIPQSRQQSMQQTVQPQSNQTGDNINHELDAAWDDYLKSTQGQQASHSESAPMPTDEQVLQRYRNKTGNTNEQQDESSFVKNAGKITQSKESAKYRAQARKDIGQSQLALSNSGSSLNRMASIIKNPLIQDMRSKIPFFQDKQLSYLEKMGTPEQKKLIGDFIATGEQIIASGVQAFGGKPLVREFDLLQRQKINRNDPVHVAEGKLRASIALHDIAEKKNEIIDNLLDKGINEAEAVKRANKMVDVSAIEKQTEDLLRDKPTDKDIKYMAKKHDISPEEVKKRLKDKGIY